MTGNEYQVAAMRTASTYKDRLDMLVNGAMGLSGESGEVIDIIKKVLFQGHTLDSEHSHLIEELGDVAWYLALAATAIGYDLDTIFEMNIEKLKKRYPDGFSKEKSIHRQE